MDHWTIRFYSNNEQPYLGVSLLDEDDQWYAHIAFEKKIIKYQTRRIRVSKLLAIERFQ